MNANTRVLLFIVGMHRSGTSALARAFCACGATTGDDVLAPMEGVNSEGFWEDKSLVALNEELLHEAGLDWYSIGQDSNSASDPVGVATFYQCAKSIIERGFGDGAVELVKDPRLCVTLPLWLRVCDELGVTSRVCIIRREPVEVALSLEKRDGFPLSYGYWLASNYEQAIRRVVPDNLCSATTTFDQLLESPIAELDRLIGELSLPLAIDATALPQSVEKRLKHQLGGSGDSGSLSGDGLDTLLRGMARAFVARGNELSRLGESHTDAITVISERDRQIKKLGEQLQALGSQHTYALGVIKNKDQQLQELGEQHRYAVEIVEERDALLAAYNDKMGMLREELALQQPWKKKALLLLGSLKREK